MNAFLNFGTADDGHVILSVTTVYLHRESIYAAEHV